MYRFRSVNRILKYKELEEEEIFFSSPCALNDPMEGVRDIVWIGDYIIWANLFKHYILSLEKLVLLRELGHSREKLLNTKVNRTLKGNNLSLRIVNRFMENKYVKELLVYLSELNRPIRREELLSYIRIIHPLGLKYIVDTLVESKIMDDCFKTNEYINLMNYDKLARCLEEQKQIYINDNQIEDLFQKYMHLETSFNFFIYHEALQNSEILLIKFQYPTVYLSQIEDFTNPQFFIACFMDDCTNSAVWGHYADGHRGVCMIYDFDNSDNNKSIGIRMPIGFTGDKNNGTIYAYQDIELNNVTYSDKLVEINFFESMIKIFQLKESLRKKWFFDDNGKMSVVYKSFSENSNEWEKEFLMRWNNAVCNKNSVWAYERESRLVIKDFWDDFENKGVVLKYKFSNLKGIIFGIKTEDEDKRKIFEIVKSKGRTENDFEFFQAFYNPKTGKIDKFALPLFEASQLCKRK